jgi:hypothetical protein
MFSDLTTEGIPSTLGLWTIVLILVILWIAGMVTATTMGGLLHVLLVVAIVVVIVNLLRGRNPI